MAATQSHRPSLHSLPRSGENMERTRGQNFHSACGGAGSLGAVIVPSRAIDSAVRTVPMWPMPEVCFLDFSVRMCKPGENPDREAASSRVAGDK